MDTKNSVIEVKVAEMRNLINTNHGRRTPPTCMCHFQNFDRGIIKFMIEAGVDPMEVLWVFYKNSIADGPYLAEEIPSDRLKLAKNGGEMLSELARCPLSIAWLVESFEQVLKSQ